MGTCTVRSLCSPRQIWWLFRNDNCGLRMHRHNKVAVLLVATLAFASLAAAQHTGKPDKGRERGKSLSSQKTGRLATTWAPPDIDDLVPPVDPSLACPVSKVLKAAGDRAQELVSTLPKFTATERMEHYEADTQGNWGKPHLAQFDYLVEMEHVREGMLVMDEIRDRTRSLEKFPAHIATLGLPAVAMVFHPFFVNEYDMKCEGMGKLDRYQAWQVRFQQRPDKLARLRAYRIRNLSYPIKLKGRAWIDANTFQVVRIETDLVEPVPQIALRREHLTVDYRPVKFHKQNEELWLPQTAEVFMDFRGHHYRRRHTFTDFMLFAVDVLQTVQQPTEPPPQP